MPGTEDDKMLTVWAISRQLRRGLLVSIISILIIAVVKLYVDKSRMEKRFYDKLDRQNDELLKILIPSINKVNNTVNAVDTIAKRADSTLTIINSKSK